MSCMACRRYVHVYQQRLDALQPKAAAAADSATDSTADSKAEGSTAAAVGAATAADGSSSESSAALQLELQRLEHHLCVEDILLCRSLAELALERRSGASGTPDNFCRAGVLTRLPCVPCAVTLRKCGWTMILALMDTFEVNVCL
jgi:hypothetical protein